MIDTLDDLNTAYETSVEGFHVVSAGLADQAEIGLSDDNWSQLSDGIRAVCASGPPGAGRFLHYVTPALEGRLLRTMAQMRALLRADAEPGPRWVAAKCRPCGYRETCWGSFD